MAATITPNHAAQMRPTRLTVTADHVLEFIGHGQRSLVTAVTPHSTEAPLRFVSLSAAYEHLRTAEGATAALLARVFGERA